MEEIVMIWGRGSLGLDLDWSIIQRAAAWVRKYGPFVLMLMRRSKLSSLASRMSVRSVGATPALFTRRSRRLNFSRIVWRRRARSVEFEMSAWQISARPHSRAVARA